MCNTQIQLHEEKTLKQELLDREAIVKITITVDATMINRKPIHQKEKMMVMLTSAPWSNKIFTISSSPLEAAICSAVPPRFIALT
jgi:hypothetical protein